MVMTSGTHNRRIHYFSQHWLIPVSLVQLLWPGTLIAKDTVSIPRVLLSVAQYQFTKPPTANALPNNGTFPEVEFDVTFKSLGIGETLFTGFEDLGFSIDFEGTGDAERLSYGASWSSRLTDHVSYSIGLNIQEYTFKNITDPNVSFTDEIKEKLSNITFST